jgi:two-component system, NarL family, response regulator NreC
MPGHLQLVAESPERAGRLAGPGSPIKVILVDDHPSMRRNLRQLLDREDGVNVIAEAGDLAAAVRHVHEHLPHVLVVALKTPHGPSFEAIGRLRDDVPATEIVVLTMDVNPAFAPRALDAGAVGFVLKDRADDELPAAVRGAVSGREYVSPRVAAGVDALRQAAGASGLTAREVEVLRLIALGYTSAEIANQLHLSRRTIETHRARIHRKLQTSTRAGLVQFALERHLIGA